MGARPGECIGFLQETGTCWARAPVLGGSAAMEGGADNQGTGLAPRTHLRNVDWSKREALALLEGRGVPEKVSS